MSRLQILADTLHRFWIFLDKYCFGSAAAQCLDSNTAASGKTVQKLCLDQICPYHIKKRLLDPVCGRSGLHSLNRL